MDRRKTMALSVLIGVLGIAVLLMPGRSGPPRPAFGLGDWSQVSIQALKDIYEQEPSNEHLRDLVKALSWQVEVKGEQGAEDDLLRYGTELMDRARADTVDLQKLDDEDKMLELITILKVHGVG